MPAPNLVFEPFFGFGDEPKFFTVRSNATKHRLGIVQEHDKQRFVFWPELRHRLPGDKLPGTMFLSARAAFEISQFCDQKTMARKAQRRLKRSTK